MTEKVTEMKLKVDLQCPCCYKKVKKILCKFPQIRDQVYDEKNNIVKITVVCCSPEKIRDKICCKGGKVIQSIEIVVPPPPKPEKPKEKPKEPEKPKQPEKPKDKPKEKEKPEQKPREVKEKVAETKEKSKESEKPKEAPKPAPTPALPLPPEPIPIPLYPPGVCCSQCYEGFPGGQCYQGDGRPVPPPPCYDHYGCQCGYGYPRGRYGCRCDSFSDENPSACSIM